METGTMGRVVTDATVENLEDLYSAERGRIKPEEIRRIEIKDALVDSGATSLALPTRMIQQLGLTKRRDKPGTSSRGATVYSIYDAVRLTIMGRDAIVQVVEVPDDVPVLIGQLPLEWMDWVIDMKNQKLIGNPAHGGEQMIEMY
ncbi:MAG: aspartyl protease family protein [Gemmataceae bacterium]